VLAFGVQFEDMDAEFAETGNAGGMCFSEIHLEIELNDVG
jgi:hypothetical protein